MFVLAHRIIKMQSIYLEASDESVIKDFADATQISDYSKEALSSLVKNGLVELFSQAFCIIFFLLCL